MDLCLPFSRLPSSSLAFCIFAGKDSHPEAGWLQGLSPTSGPGMPNAKVCMTGVAPGGKS